MLCRATTALGRKQQFVSILLSADGNHIFRLQSNAQLTRNLCAGRIAVKWELASMAIWTARKLSSAAACYTYSAHETPGGSS